MDSVLTINGKQTDNSGVMTLTPGDLSAVPTSALGANSGVATLDSAGKLQTSQLPSLAISDTFVVASQAAMLALTAQRGDIAIRSDQNNRAYILTADVPGTLANWVNIDQGLAASLQAMSSLVPAADQMPYFDSTTTAALAAFTAFGRSIVALASVAAARTLFGLDYTTIYQNLPTASFKNKLINGNFDFWQRGTSVLYSNNFGTGNAAGFGPDRWNGQVYGGPSASGTASVSVSQQAFTPGQLAVPGEPTFFARLQATSVPTPGGGGASIRMSQQIEDVRYINGQYVYGVWLKADSARTVGMTIQQNFGTGGSTTVMVAQQTFAITTNWAFYQLPFAPPSVSGKTIGTGSSLFVMLWLYAQDNSLVPGMTIAPFGSFSTTAFLDIARTQVEPGTVATVFEQRPIATELSLCQRYYEKSFLLTQVPTNAAGAPHHVGSAFVTTAIRSQRLEFKVQKRTSPTIVLYSSTTAATPAGVWAAFGSSGSWLTTSVSSAAVVLDDRGFCVDTNWGSSAWTFGQCTLITGNWTADAEL